MAKSVGSGKSIFFEGWGVGFGLSSSDFFKFRGARGLWWWPSVAVDVGGMAVVARPLWHGRAIHATGEPLVSLKRLRPYRYNLYGHRLNLYIG